MLALAWIGSAMLVFAAGWLAARSRTDDSATAEEGSAETPDRQFAAVLDRQPIGVVIASPAGSIEYRNSAARLLDGTHVGALVDGAIGDLHAGALAGERNAETLDLFGPPRRVVHIVCEPLLDGRVVAFISDVTERARADQIRTDFVANVSHELRTPIGALMVLAEALADSDHPDDTARIVQRMQLESERASRTIDDLIELSRIEAASAHEAEPVRLADVVRDAVSRVVELAAANEITISTLDPVDAAGPRAEGVVVLGDHRQLVSAVGNLVENAVKYSDPGDAVLVRVRTDGRHGEIVVVDEGVGIPRADVDRIFERFYRVDRARSRRTGGTGLGLSIVRHVAELHDGSVRVDSVEGDGTTFVLQLPLAEPNGQHVVDSETSAGDEQRAGRGVA